MMKKNSSWWFKLGALIGLTALSLALASTPRNLAITDDSALYDNLSEIRVNKQGRINFDDEIARLSAMEAKYQERLPSVGKNAPLNGAISRIEKQKYQFRVKPAPVIKQ